MVAHLGLGMNASSMSFWWIIGLIISIYLNLWVMKFSAQKAYNLSASEATFGKAFMQVILVFLLNVGILIAINFLSTFFVGGTT